MEYGRVTPDYQNKKILRTAHFADARLAARIKAEQVERELREYLRKHPEDKSER